MFLLQIKTSSKEWQATNSPMLVLVGFSMLSKNNGFQAPCIINEMFQLRGKEALQIVWEKKEALQI